MRRIISIAVKLVFLALAIWWMAGRVRFDAVGRILKEVDPVRFGVGVAISFLPVMLAAMRMRLMLRGLGLQVPYAPLLGVVQMGQFFSLFLPGSAGDDVARVVYVSKLAKGRVKASFAAVLLDRAIGFGCLFVLVFWCAPLNWSLVVKTQGVRWLTLCFSATGACVLIGALWLSCLSRSTLERFFTRISDRVRKHPRVVEVLQLGIELAGKRRTLAVVALGALLTQLAVCLMFWAAGHTVGVELPLVQWISIVPIIAASAILPITFSGIGVRDYLLVLFLGPATGLGDERILATSLVVLAFSLCMALSGGLVYVFRKTSMADRIPVEG